MKDIVVPLIRRFVPAKPHFGEWEFLHPEPGGAVQGWRALEEHYRVLVLADAGAGKKAAKPSKGAGAGRRSTTPRKAGGS